MGNIKLNEPITFGSEGKIREFEPYGFDLKEKELCWTVREEAGFSGNLGAVQGDVRLQVSAMPYIPNEQVRKQQFFIFVNGQWTGFRSLSNFEVVEFILPRALVSARLVRIAFAIPTAVSPKELGLGEDVRKLGIAILKVAVLPLQAQAVENIKAPRAG
jgi:hypothetical protein